MDADEDQPPEITVITPIEAIRRRLQTFIASGSFSLAEMLGDLVREA